MSGQVIEPHSEKLEGVPQRRREGSERLPRRLVQEHRDGHGARPSCRPRTRSALDEKAGYGGLTVIVH